MIDGSNRSDLLKLPKYVSMRGRKSCSRKTSGKGLMFRVGPTCLEHIFSKEATALPCLTYQSCRLLSRSLASLRCCSVCPFWLRKVTMATTKLTRAMRSIISMFQDSTSGQRLPHIYPQGLANCRIVVLSLGTSNPQRHCNTLETGMVASCFVPTLPEQGAA